MRGPPRYFATPEDVEACLETSEFRQAALNFSRWCPSDLATKMGYNSGATNIVFEGDSLCVCGTTLFPAYVVAQMGWSVRNQWANVAIGSTRLDSFISRGAANVDVRFSAAYEHNWVILRTVGDLSSDYEYDYIWSHLVTWCTDRRAAGWRIAIMTYQPNSFSHTGDDDIAAREEIREGLNASIVSDGPDIADIVVDIKDDPCIGKRHSEANTLYYSDRLHTTADGNAIAARYVSDALLAYFLEN